MSLVYAPQGEAGAGDELQRAWATVRELVCYQCLLLPSSNWPCNACKTERPFLEFNAAQQDQIRVRERTARALYGVN